MPRPFFEKDTKSKIDEIIRVNFAGEYGAQRIYQGQIDYTKDKTQQEILKHMKAQEDIHFQYFNELMQLRGTRPSMLLPLWNAGAYFLGALSAIMGNKYAMQVTESVEDVIEKHYQQQIDYLKRQNCEKKLLEKITQFRLEEIEHKEIAQNHQKQNKIEQVVDLLVKSICKNAIKISKKY